MKPNSASTACPDAFHSTARDANKTDKLILLLLSIMPTNAHRNFHRSRKGNSLENWSAISISETTLEELQPRSQSDLLTWFNSHAHRQMERISPAIVLYEGTIWKCTQWLWKERKDKIYKSKVVWFLLPLYLDTIFVIFLNWSISKGAQKTKRQHCKHSKL